MTNPVRLISSGTLAILCLWSWSAQRAPAAAQTTQPFESVARLVPTDCDFCHARDRQAHLSGFYTGSYDALVDGAFRNGRFQKAIVPGNAQDSPLVEYIEGRRRPRLTDHHAPLPAESVKAFRDWIDQGARAADSTFREHELTLPHVDVDPATHAFWLACASREDGLDVSKRVKVTDERTGAIVAYDWPNEESEQFDRHGRWHQWKITVPATVSGPVTVQLLVAGAGFIRNSGSGRRDPADGSVFVLDPKKMVPDDLDQIAAAVPAPNPPPHRTVELRFRTLADADLTLDVFQTRGTTAVFHRDERDLPAGQNSVTWTFGQTRPAAGWYEARFRFKARRPGTRQPDIGMTFEIS